MDRTLLWAPWSGIPAHFRHSGEDGFVQISPGFYPPEGAIVLRIGTDDLYEVLLVDPTRRKCAMERVIKDDRIVPIEHHELYAALRRIRAA